MKTNYFNLDVAILGLPAVHVDSTLESWTLHTIITIGPEKAVGPGEYVTPARDLEMEDKLIGELLVQGASRGKIAKELDVSEHQAFDELERKETRLRADPIRAADRAESRTNYASPVTRGNSRMLLSERSGGEEG